MKKNKKQKKLFNPYIHFEKKNSLTNSQKYGTKYTTRVSHKSYVSENYGNTRQNMYRKNGRNAPHYYYLFYKIFDMILPRDDIESTRVLRFIKLPGKQTLRKRDKEFDIILKFLK